MIALCINLIQIVNGITDSTLQMVKQYCLDHTSDILQGKNPIQDLISTGLISHWDMGDFQGKTCSDIDLMIGVNDLNNKGSEFLRDLANAD